MNTRRATSFRTFILYTSLCFMVLAASIWLVPGYISSTELMRSPLPQYLSEMPDATPITDGAMTSETPQAIELAAAFENAAYMPLGSEIAFRSPDTAIAHNGDNTVNLLLAAPQCGINGHGSALAMNCRGLETLQ